MTEEDQTLQEIRQYISQMPEHQRNLVESIARTIRAMIEAPAQGPAAMMAVALVGAEIAARSE